MIAQIDGASFDVAFDQFIDNLLQIAALYGFHHLLRRPLHHQRIVNIRFDDDLGTSIFLKKKSPSFMAVSI